MKSFLFYVSIIGVVLSAYAIYVEHKTADGGEFEALCDINSWMSCSKVFSGVYGHLFFGVPNAVFGFVFYVCVILSTFRVFNCIPALNVLVFLACLAASIFSCVLAYLLSMLGDCCILCVSTYFVNFALLWASYKQMNAGGAKTDRKKQA